MEKLIHDLINLGLLVMISKNEEGYFVFISNTAINQHFEYETTTYPVIEKALADALEFYILSKGLKGGMNNNE